MKPVLTLEKVRNAIGKTDPSYYSVEMIAKGVGRSIAAINSKVIKGLGGHIKNGMAIYKDED